MTYKHSLVAAGALIAIMLTVALTVTLNTPTGASASVEESIKGDVSNCVGLRNQCRYCSYVPYNWRGRQACASMCQRYFDNCYDRTIPVTPYVRG